MSARVASGIMVVLAACGRYSFETRPDAERSDSDADAAVCTPGTITAPRPVTACPFACHNPKLTWIGDSYVLCWKQETTADQSAANQLMCTRLDRDGNQATVPTMIAVMGEPVSMSLTWTGVDLLLSYAANPTGDYEVYTMRFDPAGNAMPATRVTTAAGTGWGTSNAWTGSQIGVSFYDPRNDPTTPSIYFARVAADGTNLGELRLTTGFRAFGTSTVWTGSEFVVAWRDVRDSGTWDVYVARIDATGTQIGAVIPVTDNSMLSISPSLEWTGDALAVAYTKGGSAGENDVHFSLLDASGARLAPESQVSFTPGTSRSVQLVSLGSGAGFVSAWFDVSSGSEEMNVQRLDAFGAPVGSMIPVAGAAYFTGSAPNAPAMARSDRGIGTVWPVGTSTNAEINFVEVCP